MNCWPLCIKLLWWFSWGSGPPSPLCWNYLWWQCDQRCYNGHILGKGSSGVPWTSLQLSIGEYVAAVEKVCHQLKQGEAEELRGEIKSILKNIQPPKSNISKEEAKALRELKNDNTRMILTMNKGVSMVVMDREDYIKKSEELLSQSTYKTIPTDPKSSTIISWFPCLKPSKQKVG